MRTAYRILLVLAPLWAVLPGPRERQQTAGGAPPGSFTMMSLQKAGTVAPPQSILLLFGDAARPSDYAGSVFVNQNGCTAVLVGPSVLISAAHCFPADHSQTVYFDLTAGASRHAECRAYQHYDEKKNIGDFALCQVNAPITDVTYETISYDPSLVRTWHDLLLTGWGQTQTMAPHQQFTTGLAVVVEAPSLRPGESNAITTLGVGLAEGDSGGAAFKVLSASQNSRVIVAINSARDPHGNLNRSTLSSLSSYAKDFVTDWASTHGNPPICTAETRFEHCHR